MATLSEWCAAIEHAYQPVTGRPVSRPGVHVALAVGRLETGLGTAWAAESIHATLVARGWTTASLEDWQEAARGSNNLGAVQYRRPSEFGAPPWPAISPDGRGFLYYDTSPQSDGTSKPYPMYFRRYTVDSAAPEFLRVLYVIAGRSAVQDAAERGDLPGVSRALHASRYYEGFGATVEDRIARHHRSLVSAAIGIGRELGWPLPDGTELPPRTIRQGATCDGCSRCWV